MFKTLRLLIMAALVAGCLSVQPVQAKNIALDPIPPCILMGGALSTLNDSEICTWTPPFPNGDIVIFAHGYVQPGVPLNAFYSQLWLPDGSTIPALVTSLGYTFVTTSYRKNGLAVKEGVLDVRDLAVALKTTHPAANIYLVGGSEGGLVTTLVAEKYPTVIKAGLAMCGPIGDFPKQINYFGDARVVFDYFFPGVIPGSPVAIPDATLLAWTGGSLPTAINLALASDASKTSQYLNVTRIPYDPAVLTETVLGVLWYNIFATNETRQELFGGPVNLATNQGQPFNNRTKWYTGSLNDWLLNKTIARFSADPKALTEINKYYQTSGKLSIPLVTLHNTQDPADPYWHETLYNLKVLASGSLANHINLPVFRTGHCNFTAGEAVFAFSVMLLMAGQPLPFTAIEQALPTEKMLKPYLEMQKAHPGISPGK